MPRNGTNPRIRHALPLPIVEGRERARIPGWAKKLMVALVVAVVGGGGVVASGVTDTKADRNERDIAIQAAKIESAQIELRAAEVRIDQHDEMLRGVSSDVREIKGGIESLKKENVDRLERELREARRELRRRRRGR